MYMCVCIYFITNNNYNAIFCAFLFHFFCFSYCLIRNTKRQILFCLKNNNIILNANKIKEPIYIYIYTIITK